RVARRADVLRDRRVPGARRELPVHQQVGRVRDVAVERSGELVVEEAEVDAAVVLRRLLPAEVQVLERAGAEAERAGVTPRVRGAGQPALRLVRVHRRVAGDAVAGAELQS